MKDAPNISEDGHLSPQEEQQLYRHYGIDYGSGDTAGRATNRTATGLTELGTPTGRHAMAGDVADGETTRDRDVTGTAT